MNREQHQMTSVPRVNGKVRKEASILGRLRAWWERQQTAQRMLAADPGERIRMLQDIGAGPQDLRQLTASPRSGETLLPVMMNRFGIDEASLRPGVSGVMRDLQRVCATCPSTRRCSRALSVNASAEECRSFCPNAETLAALAPGGILRQPETH